MHYLSKVILYIQRPSGTCSIDHDLAVTQTKHIHVTLNRIQSFMHMNCVNQKENSPAFCSVHPFPPLSALSLLLSPPDIVMLLSHMSHCLHAAVLSVCVTRLTDLSIHTLSTPLTLALNPAVGSSSSLPSCPPVHHADLSWLIPLSLTPSQLNITSENSPLLFYIYLFRSLSISCQTNCMHRHSIKMCWFQYFPLSDFQSISHKPRIVRT